MKQYCNLTFAAESPRIDGVRPEKDTGQQTRGKRELTVKSRVDGGDFGSFSSRRESSFRAQSIPRLSFDRLTEAAGECASGRFDGVAM